MHLAATCAQQKAPKSQSLRLKLRSQSVKRVLVLGGAGYLGSVLVGQLLRRGFAVRVLDLLLFGDQSVEEFRRHPSFEFVYGDVRDRRLVARYMRKCDAVIHLAAVVGDSACEEHKSLAIDVNRNATPMLADVARNSGVVRFLFASSCSVYGASENCLDETSPLKPLSVYAQTKSDAESILLSSKEPHFAPTVLRLGTLFGLSPRMRFDLIVNLLVAQAASLGRITIWNGKQWRPFLHVQDAGRAFLACLDADRALACGQIFNVGSPSLNLQIGALGEEIASCIPSTRVSRLRTDDRRNYRVSFQKIQGALGFRCGKTLPFGIREIHAAIRSGTIADFTTSQFNNHMAMRNLAAHRNWSISPPQPAAALVGADENWRERELSDPS